MPIDKEQPQQDPVEGSREMIDRELERDDNKGSDDKTSGQADDTGKGAPTK